MTTMLHELSLPQPAVRTVVQRKDYFRPLHVDCSIEYELPSQVKPPVTDKIDPLLMIHPCYFRRIEAQKRSPFINNLPSAIRQKSTMLSGSSNGQGSIPNKVHNSRTGSNNTNNNSQLYSQYIKSENQIKSERNVDFLFNSVKQEVEGNESVLIKQEDQPPSGIKQTNKSTKNGVNFSMIKRENSNAVKQENSMTCTKFNKNNNNNQNELLSNASNNNCYLMDTNKKQPNCGFSRMQTIKTNEIPYQNYNNHVNQNVPMQFNNSKVQIMHTDYQKQWMMDQQLLNKMMLMPNPHQNSISLNDSSKHLQDVSFLNTWLAENHVNSSDMYLNKTAMIIGGKYRARSNRLHPYVPNIHSASTSAAVGLQLGGGGFQHFNQAVVQQIPCYNL